VTNSRVSRKEPGTVAPATSFGTSFGTIGSMLFALLLFSLLTASPQTSEAQITAQKEKVSATAKKHRKRRKRVKRPTKLDGYVKISSYYDDNVFSYSDSDRTLFTNRVKPERFPIDQLDDIVTAVAARGDVVWNRKRRSYWRMSVRYSASLYQNNTFRNNNQFGVELRRKKRHSYTALSAVWTPNYYLRHLFWSSRKASILRQPGDPTYVAANLSKVGFFIEREQRLARRFYGRLKVGYVRKNYGAPFDERDNTTFSVAGRLRKILSRRVEVYASGAIASISSSASDYNVAGISDISNTETKFRGGFEVKLDKRGKLVWNESFSYTHQSYTTSDTADVFHYNRADNEVRVGSRLTWSVHPRWRPRIFYTLRNSTSNVPVGVSDVGAYSSNRFGLQIVHYF